jgi:hypothetical protein
MGGGSVVGSQGCWPWWFSGREGGPVLALCGPKDVGTGGCSQGGGQCCGPGGLGWRCWALEGRCRGESQGVLQGLGPKGWALVGGTAGGPGCVPGGFKGLARGDSKGWAKRVDPAVETQGRPECGPVSAKWAGDRGWCRRGTAKGVTQGGPVVDQGGKRQAHDAGLSGGPG